MPQLSIMIKPASSACNLRCRYCFYHDVAEERESPDFGIMTADTTKRLIDKALEFADGESIYFAFQGGEPLIAGLDYFRKFVSYVSEKNIKRSKIYYSLQTNGTLLTDKWAEFFKENGFLIGLSLDGDETANRFRVDANGEPTFTAVCEAADMLTYYGVEFNILSVVTGWMADNIGKVYGFLTSRGYKYLQFIPCLRPFGCKDESELFMTVRQYERFLTGLFNHYVKDYVRGNYVSVRNFDNIVRLYLGQQAEQCGLNGYCSHQFVIEGNGNVYPCDFYCLDEWLLGNINESGFDALAHSDRAIAFLQQSVKMLPDKCRTCRFGYLCRAGGCKRAREDRDYCQAYYNFYSACLPMFRVFAGEK